MTIISNIYDSEIQINITVYDKIIGINKNTMTLILSIFTKE
jgi:hypothetical protein